MTLKLNMLGSVTFLLTLGRPAATTIVSSAEVVGHLVLDPSLDEHEERVISDLEVY